MQVSNNYQIHSNYQPNFKRLEFYGQVEKVKSVLAKKIPSKDLESFYKRLKESPVTTTIGFADSFPDRLDATIYYKHPNLKPENGEVMDYIAEGKLFNLLSIRPRKFINRVLLRIESLEETFRIGRYAQ